MKYASVFTLSAALWSIAQAAVPTPDNAPLPSLAPMIKRVSPAVVNIGIRGTVRDQRQFQSAGSGVIFDAGNGYIVTNAHVLENAAEITVTLQDGRDLSAEVIGTDEPSDVAVLKVKGSNLGLAQLTLGDSSRLEVGDFVVAIGNPFGLSHTVTSGIVSALGRSGINNDGFEDFIQTDASINPGNSGGALVNLRGELIGINTAILSRTGGNIGIGFAIPVNMAHGVMDQLRQFGKVRRGILGVNIYSVTPDMARSLNMKVARGALVSQVVEGSAAQKAGIKAGDVITAVNGKPVKTNGDLRNAVGLLKIGDQVEVALLREGRTLQMTAVIAATSEAVAEKK